MESELSPDNQKYIPPVPLKTYQWEDLKRDRDAGGYPWTHLLKAPLEGEVTAEDIIRETTPRRSMSRDVSKSRTHSPIDHSVQKILNLNSSPGSSRKHSGGGKDEGIHIPNFSKEISLDSDEDTSKAATTEISRSDSPRSGYLSSPAEKSKSVSPKGILKRRLPEAEYIGVTEVREKTKCCHPLVNKIKHLADKTMHKLERSERSPTTKRKKNEEAQEIRQLKNSPGAVRRQKFGAIKLGDSDEMSKTMSMDTPPSRNKKEHIYEDIEETPDTQNSQEIPENAKELKNIDYKENDSVVERKSIASQDPSLVTEDNTSLKLNEYVMEKLHKNDVNKEATLLDEEMDSEEANVEEIFQNQKDDIRHNNDSPNITITEITDDDNSIEHSTTVPIETSPTPSPNNNNNIERKKSDVISIDKDWSGPNSDHEYEIIDKPPPNIIYTAPSIDEKPTMVKTEDELSSTTSLERKYLQNTSDEDEQINEKEHITDAKKSEELISAEILQKDIEERFFVNTPSTASRTECEISTSQVDSSALENLPLKRGSRSKNQEIRDNKIQQRIKEGTGKLKSQAGKLKTKLDNLRNKQFSLPERPKINFPERPKFRMPERTKFSFPERPKFTLPDRRKFSLPERPKFKSINLTGKLSMKDRKKFSFPERPKFNVPDLPKFKMPERPKISFPSIGRKKESKIESNKSESTSDLQNIATVDFEAKTYPRLFGRKKKAQIEKTSSSPTLNREDTPPPTFTFTRVRDKIHGEPSTYIPDSPEEPREYGTVDREENYNNDIVVRQEFNTYDFDKLDQEYDNEDDIEANQKEISSATPPSKQEYTHINEINNDEFFVRPRGISHENIQVREYLSDEIRQAFNIPKNILADMGSDTRINSENIYANDEDEDPELIIENRQDMVCSTEDINERDDGYYTFPPVRPSRAKRKKKDCESIKFIDDSMNASMQFSEVDLRLSDDPLNDKQVNEYISSSDNDLHKSARDIRPLTDLHSIHEYANDDIIEYPDSIPIQSQTLPMPPKRKKKNVHKNTGKHSSLTNVNNFTSTETWQAPQEQVEDIIVYRTEHEYIVPVAETVMTENSPLPPRRTRSRSSRATSLCDDDRTSHGAESLILDAQISPTNEVDVEIERSIRHESPGYATVDKGQYIPEKISRRSKSKTPPIRTRKSNSSERKYYTVSGVKASMPDRPPRKKSSTSLVTLNNYTKGSINGDTTQYVEIDEPRNEERNEVHKILQSGEVVNKMKDRPLPPPPRPPRGPKRKKDCEEPSPHKSNSCIESSSECIYRQTGSQEVVEIEVSTQTDPLPDDIDFELGIDENFDISMSSSLRDIIDEEPILGKIHEKLNESRPISRTTSKSEKSLKLSDPKISSIGRSSPTVILVEKRVSSPTRINERQEILTEASLTVQHIDIEDSQIPDVPPLPVPKPTQSTSVRNIISQDTQYALERSVNIQKDAQLDNLVTQRLQVKDLDVGRLNVSELQATKILVSDIEGMTLNVNELDSKSGHISVSGIEFSQTVIDEIVKKFAEISTNIIPPGPQASEASEPVRPVSREEETQTEISQPEMERKASVVAENILHPPPPPRSSHQENIEEISPPQRPPPPDITPLLYSYLQDITTTTTTMQPRSFRERYFNELEGQQPTPPPPRRAKRKPAILHSESSSDDGKLRPSPRRMPPIKAHEPSITEAGAQFLRVCQTSISRTFRNIFNSFMSYINGAEDKRDVQMAMVIFLVLIAGLIMFGLNDSRTIHHHHWEFFNPPNGKP